MAAAVAARLVLAALAARPGQWPVALLARAVVAGGPARSGAAAPVARRQRRARSEPVKVRAVGAVAPRLALAALGRKALFGWFTSLRGKRRAFLCTVAKSIVKNVPAR